MENQWSYTQCIAAYSTSFRYEDLTPQAVFTAKNIVLDTLGALFAAWPDRHPVSRLIGDFVQQMGGTPECTVLGGNFKAPAANAALANGTMGYAADIEGAGIARMHAAAVFVPTALVMGERQKLDGKTLIAALALAYDVAARVSEASRTEHSYPHSFHPSAVFGTFGAAVITGYALKLDAPRFVNTCGLAGNVASGLIAWVDDPTEHSRSYGIGVAARNGVTAGLLAERGFGGPQGIFDPMKYNIFDAFSGTMHLEELTRDLGSEFYIERADGFKQYPCCGDIHSGIDALLGIMSEHNLHPNEIVQITHKVKATRRPVIDNNPLRSHCAQYIMAIAAIEREIRWDDFLHDRRDEPAISEMTRRIHLMEAPELSDSPGAAPAIVEVKTSRGQLLSKRVDFAKGRSENPLSQAELEAKFVRWAAPVVGEARALEIIAAVQRLEELTDICELIALMHEPPN
ncbi:MAG: MmgE/PrpD family protein [Candidatus Poribacteria bacterium]|nr:MmgE/PrpD family protein [Candidatus Poribacteria bacterium]